VIQLILGSVAFKRGWRWRVLIPIALGIVLAVIMAGAGVNLTEAGGAALVPDILVDIGLLIMCIIPPPQPATAVVEAVEVDAAEVRVTAR
jgi:hypothetical protein